MAGTDFGTLVTIAGVTMKVINVPPPKLSVGTIETTNHSSAGWREYIADALKGASSFSLTAEGTGAMLAQLATVWAAFAPVAIVFTEYGFPAWTFNGLVSDIQLSTANAKSPGEETIDITIQPTGAVTIAAAAGNWYDDVTYLYFGEGGLYTTAAHPTTHQMVVWAVIPGLPPFQVSAAQMADLTFASVTVGTATVAATGIITTVASGDTHITAKITAAPTIETICVVTVP